jgi:hypothetical protein
MDLKRAVQDQYPAWHCTLASKDPRGPSTPNPIYPQHPEKL